MLWEKAKNQQNNKMYRESVEEYEKKQKYLAEVRLNEQQSSSLATLPNEKNISISVGGEPLFSHDRHGNTLFNKMKKIDENFDEIQDIVNEFAFSFQFFTPVQRKLYLGPSPIK